MTDDVKRALANAKSHAWRKAHPDKVIAYREAHREQYTAYMREYMKKWRAKRKGTPPTELIVKVPQPASEGTLALEQPNLQIRSK